MANAIADGMNAIVSIDGAGRIVLPKPIRDQFNLLPGSRLEIATAADRLELKPMDSSPALACEQGLWVHQGAAQASLTDAVQQLRDERLRGPGPGARR